MPRDSEILHELSANGSLRFFGPLAVVFSLPFPMPHPACRTPFQVPLVIEHVDAELRLILVKVKVAKLGYYFLRCQSCLRVLMSR